MEYCLTELPRKGADMEKSVPSGRQLRQPDGLPDHQTRTSHKLGRVLQMLVKQYSILMPTQCAWKSFGRLALCGRLRGDRCYVQVRRSQSVCYSNVPYVATFFTPWDDGQTIRTFTIRSCYSRQLSNCWNLGTTKITQQQIIQLLLKCNSSWPAVTGQVMRHQCINWGTAGAMVGLADWEPQQKPISTRIASSSNRRATGWDRQCVLSRTPLKKDTVPN